MRHQKRFTSGFTLIELLVSFAVLGVVSLYLTDMLTRQSRAYTVVDQVTEVQQNVRAIAHLMEREVRSTGYLAPEAAAVCGLDRTAGPDILFLTDAPAMRFEDDKNYERGARLVGGYDDEGTDEVIQLETLVVDNDPFYDTDGDGTPDSDFQAGGGVIIVDPQDQERGASCGIITQAPDVGNNTITVDFQLGGAEPDGMPLGPEPVGGSGEALVAVPANVYQVIGTLLRRNDLVLAQDVEDLQFAVFYDIDGDGSVDPGEYQGDDTSDYVASDWDNRDMREIRFNIVARSRLQDVNFGTGNQLAGTFQRTENRDPVPGTDGFRRRVYTSSVRPRNVGSRARIAFGTIGGV